jgi:hypothetical protein
VKYIDFISPLEELHQQQQQLCATTSDLPSASNFLFNAGNVQDM